MTAGPVHTDAMLEHGQTSLPTSASEKSADLGEDRDAEDTGEDLQQPALTNTSHVDVPPNGGYGWVCVACVFLINAHTWGINSVSIFQNTKM